MKTKVLIAESGSGYGGSARYLSALLRLLDPAQFSIEVVSYGKGPFIQQIEDEGWKVNFYKAWRFPWIAQRPWYGPFGLAQLILLVPLIFFWLCSKRFRVVHLNNEILSHLPLLLAARLGGCQILCHFHGWRNLTATEKFASRYVDKFIAVTQSGADFYRRQLNGKNVEGIPNGLVIQDEEEKPAGLRERMRGQWGLHRDDFLAILIGRMIPLKGHSVFFRALAEVREKNPKVRGLVVGNDPTDNGQYLAKLKSELKTLNLENHLTFLPWQDRMGPVYEASDVVVQPSVEPESFGYVALEAMAAGKPVVASRLGGLVDVIVHEETGFLVEPGSVDELAARLAQISEDSKGAQEMGERGKTRAKKLFSMEQNAVQIQEIYNSLSRGEGWGEGRILIAESGSGYGGTAKYLTHLLTSLKRNEFAIQVSAYGRGPLIERLEKDWKVSYRPHWQFPWGEDRRRLGLCLAMTAQLLLLVPMIVFWLLRNRIRLVHLNNGIRSHLPLVIAAKFAGCRLLCHFHGWRSFTRIEKWLAPWVDQFIAISEAGGAFLRTQIPSENITAIPNGLPAAACELSKERIQSERAIFKIAKEAIVVSMIGRLVEWKGQEVYLRALAQVIKTRPHVVGIILGHDPTPGQQFLKKLHALSEQLGISAYVRFMPWQEDVYTVYSLSDHIVHASTDPEPFGLVILEAMLAGKPVIAAKGGGVTDLILERETGLLVEPNNPDELARAIAQLIEDSKFARQLGANARLRAQTFFSIEQNAARVRELYRHLLDLPQSKTRLAGLRWRPYLKRMMFNTGAVRLVRKSLGDKVPILMYHKITAQPDPFFPSLSLQTFRQQMEYVGRSYRILSLDELMECWLSDRRVPEKSLAITLDDGYSETWALASPILKALEIPVTIFLAKDPAHSDGFIWTDLLRGWMKLTPLKHYDLQANGFKGKWSLETVEERLGAAKEILAGLKGISNLHRKRALEQMAAELGVANEKLPKHWLLSLDQIQDMDRKFVKFGAHTLTHSILSRTSLEEARREIFESKRCLEAALGERVRHFAYPNGEAGDFGDEHENLLKEANFDSACTSILGLNDRETNRYALRRIYAAEESLVNFSTRLVGIGS